MLHSKIILGRSLLADWVSGISNRWMDEFLYLFDLISIFYSMFSVAAHEEHAHKESHCTRYLVHMKIKVLEY